MWHVLATRPSDDSTNRQPIMPITVAVVGLIVCYRLHSTRVAAICIAEEAGKFLLRALRLPARTAN